MRLSIVTINFRKPILTLACVASLYKTYEEKFLHNEYEIIIVDNNSGDDSVDILKKELKKRAYKNVHIYPNKENSGFGGGNNFGAEFATGDFLLFLNNDTVVGEGLLGMVEFFENNNHIGIMGGPLTSENGDIQSSAGAFYTIPRVFLLLLGLQRFGLDKSPKKIIKVDWVKGALLMIRRDFFKVLDGFDKKIFMYTEDMELCYRCYLRGKEVYFYPDIHVFHKDQGSSNRGFAIVNIYTGILYFYKKHRSPIAYVIVKLLLQTKALLLISLGKLMGNQYLLSTYEKAFSVCR